MATIFPTPDGAISMPPTSKSIMFVASRLVSTQRAPSDPFFFADVNVINAVVGSAYWLGYDDNGTFTILDEGTVATAEFTISNVPSFSSSMVLELRVRKSSSAPKYLPHNAFGVHSPTGTTIYCAQAPDLVAL